MTTRALFDKDGEPWVELVEPSLDTETRTFLNSHEIGAYFDHERGGYEIDGTLTHALPLHITKSKLSLGRNRQVKEEEYDKDGRALENQYYYRSYGSERPKVAGTRLKYIVEHNVNWSWRNWVSSSDIEL
jgi:hypothetical protein